MTRGIKKTNYWNHKVQYVGMHTAQSLLKSPKYAADMGLQAASDCSCNCYGGCSGGSCSSCSECS